MCRPRRSYDRGKNAKGVEAVEAEKDAIERGIVASVASVACGVQRRIDKGGLRMAIRMYSARSAMKRTWMS